MLKGSWVDGAPNIVYPLAENNVFILGVTSIEEQMLKMVKIRVTGETTFNWLEARYKEEYPEECGKQSTFNEGCFQGLTVGQDKYDVDLVATIIESKGIRQETGYMQYTSTQCKQLVSKFMKFLYFMFL